MNVSVFGQEFRLFLGPDHIGRGDPFAVILARLRRENKQLRLERDILSRAAAWFARETGAVPSGSSGS